jgi:hypothetical protein
MQDSDPPRALNWADYIDSLHVFNPPSTKRVPLSHRLADRDTRRAAVARGVSVNQDETSGEDPRT